MTLTVRDFFWLILVASIGCAWWADRYSLNLLFADQQKNNEVQVRSLNRIIERMGDEMAALSKP